MKSQEVFSSKHLKYTSMPSNMMLKRHLDAPKCPGELLRGEKEEDFPNAQEVHITDGIDMGCMQNEKKGIVSKEMFEIPTVDSGAVNFFAESTFFTIL